MPHAYPLMLDVADRLVVIVGGGAVATRKATGLIECGATRVRCVSPELDPGMPEQVEHVWGTYERKHLDGADLVYAATNDPDVNAAVVRDARAQGILVNRADAGDDDTAGDFSTPARFKSGPVMLTVTAGGPALSAMIRDGVAAKWDERWTQMAEALQILRPVIVAKRNVPESKRRAALRELATPEAMDVLERGGVGALRSWLEARFPEIGEGYA
jgi:siroheme synthase-like protein